MTTRTRGNLEDGADTVQSADEISRTWVMVLRCYIAVGDPAIEKFDDLEVENVRCTCHAHIAHLHAHAHTCTHAHAHMHTHINSS